MGTLALKDNEAFSMERDELIRIANDLYFQNIIQQDLSSLQFSLFDSYRCPIHSRLMKLMRKRNPVDDLDMWYLKCPSPYSINYGTGCSQMIKIKSIAQILAIREFATGRIFS